MARAPLISGRLNQRVTIERRRTEKDDHGQAVETWDAIGERWAEIVSMQATESFRAGASVSVATHRIRMRAIGLDITPTDRLRHGNRLYEIVAGVDADETRDQVLCWVKTLEPRSERNG